MKKGIYAGAFDLLHPGHLFALDWARKQCDHLTAAINIDPTTDNPKKEKPLESDLDRFVRLLSCKFVDNVTYYEGEKELEALYRFGDYDIAFISIEHEKCYTPTHKAKPIFVPRLSKHSSTRLRKEIAVSKNGNQPSAKIAVSRQPSAVSKNGNQQSAVSSQQENVMETDKTSAPATRVAEGFRGFPTVSESHLEFHAERQHQIWAHWMVYQFSLCEEQADGSLVIPAEKVARWKQQLATAYDELSEAERESDRQVVREHLPEVL